MARAQARTTRSTRPKKKPTVEELYFRSDSAYLCLLLNRRTRCIRVIDFRAGALPAKRLYIQSVAKQENVEKVEAGCRQLMDRDDQPALSARILHVGVLDRPAYLGEHTQPVARAELAGRSELCDRSALDELHREVRLATLAVVVPSGLVDLRDARMLEAGEHLRLVLEAAQHAP